MNGLSIAFSGSPQEHHEPQKPPSNTLIRERTKPRTKDYASQSPLYNEQILLEQDIVLAADAYRICQKEGLTYDELCRTALRHFIECPSRHSSESKHHP